jgi:hypothetical protein
VVTVDWLPGSKTVLRFEAVPRCRARLRRLGEPRGAEGVAFGPRWAMTSKTVLSARLLNERRTFSGDPVVIAGATKRDEVYRIARFAFGWEPQHFWQVGVAFDVGERESNIDGRDYQYNAVMANLA